MKRIVVLALAVALCQAPLASFAQAPGYASGLLAPADRYFGRLKLSILGIRNSVNDLGQRLDAHPEDAPHVFDKLLFVEDAVRDWHAHFPKDTWIPKYSFAVMQLFDRIDMDEARAHASSLSDWIVSSFPESEFAAKIRGS